MQIWWLSSSQRCALFGLSISFVKTTNELSSSELIKTINPGVFCILSIIEYLKLNDVLRQNA